MRAARGFSLIEVMTAVAVLAILAFIAVPSYRSFVVTQRVRQASYDLISSLMLARSEAIKRNASVSVSRPAAQWSQGWVVSAGAVALRTQDPYNNAVAISPSPSLATLTYSNDGRLAGGGADFTVTAVDPGVPVTPRCVHVQLSGMPVSRMGSCP